MLIAACALSAPAEAAVVAFYLPGTSAQPASSGLVDVSAIGTEAAGWITQAEQVGYPASLLPAEGTMALDPSVAQGVANLTAQLATVPATDTILLFGVSQGAIVLTKAQTALVAAAHPNNIAFIHIADPSGPTGIMGRNAGLLLPGITCVIAQPDSPYNTVFIVHQYDFFADWPAQQLNVVADLNALAGGFLFHNYAAYNVDLSTLPPSDVTTTVNSLGASTTTYFIRNTGLLPMLTLAQNAGVSPTVVNALQPILKPIVDSAYQPLPSTVGLAQKAFQTAVNTTIAAGTWAVNALRGTQATLSAAATRLTSTMPPPTGALSAASPARYPASASPKPAVKTPATQNNTTATPSGPRPSPNVSSPASDDAARDVTNPRIERTTGQAKGAVAQPKNQQQPTRPVTASHGGQ